MPVKQEYVKLNIKLYLKKDFSRYSQLHVFKNIQEFIISKLKIQFLNIQNKNFSQKHEKLKLNLYFKTTFELPKLPLFLF